MALVVKVISAGKAAWGLEHYLTVGHGPVMD